eukprot:ANDGO_01169.mRNA.1 Soluble guanylate cyclase 88E
MSVFGFSWFFRDDMRTSMRGSSAATAITWVLFVVSFISLFLFFVVYARLAQGDSGTSLQDHVVRWLSWCILSTMPIQYLMLRAYALDANDVASSWIGSPECVILFVHIGWTFFTYGLYMSLFCTLTAPLSFAIQSVSAGYFPFALFLLEGLIFLLDFLSIAVGQRIIFYITSSVICVLILGAGLYVLPWNTQEGNLLAIYPFVVIFLMNGMEASSTRSAAIIVPVAVCCFFLLWALTAVCCRRHIPFTNKQTGLAAPVSESGVFERDLYALSQAPNALVCHLILRNMVRSRLHLSKNHSFPFCIRSQMVTVSSDQAQEVLQLFDAALDIFPLSSFLAGQYCMMRHSLSLSVGRAFAWNLPSAIVRLAFMQKVTSLWSTSTTFEFFHGLTLLRSTMEVVGPDGSVGLHHIRTEINALDRIRRDIIAGIAIFWKEIMNTTSHSEVEWRTKMFLSKHGFFHKWTKHAWEDSFDLSRLWGILAYIESLENKGSVIIQRLQRIPMVTPEMLRCRARWLDDVEHNTEVAARLLIQADTLEDHLARLSRGGSRQFNAGRPCRPSNVTIEAPVPHNNGSLPSRGVSSAPSQGRSNAGALAADPQGRSPNPSSPETRGDDESVDPTGSSESVNNSSGGSSESRRLKGLRSAVMNRNSSTIWGMRMAILVTLFVSIALVIALFAISRVIIRSPVTTQFIGDSISDHSVSQNSDADAATLPLEAASRLRRPIGMLALMYRSLGLPFFLSSTEIEFIQLTIPGLLSAYRGLLKVVLDEEHAVSVNNYWRNDVATDMSFFVEIPFSPSNRSVQNITISSNYAHVFSTITMSSVLRAYEPVLQQVVECSQDPAMFGSQYYANTSYPLSNLRNICVESLLSGWFNSLVTAWNAAQSSVPHYQKETESYVDGLFDIVLTCSLCAFCITFACLVFIIIPFLVKTYNDQKRMMFLNLDFDKYALSEEHARIVRDLSTEDINSGSRRKGSTEGIRLHTNTLRIKKLDETDPNFVHAAESHLSALSASVVATKLGTHRYLYAGLLIGSAMLIIMLYCQVFTLVLFLNVSDTRKAIYELEYITSIQGLFSRAVGSAIELFPISYPTVLKIGFPQFPESLLAPLYILTSQQLSSQALQNWANLVSGDGSHTDGIPGYSDEIRDALFTPRSASLYPVYFPDNAARSLAADVSTVYDDVVSMITTGVDESVLWTVYKSRLQPLLFSIIPEKMDTVYRLLVSYYSNRSDAYVTVVNVFFAVSFIGFLLIYLFCFHNALRHLERRELQMRKILCSLSLDTLYSNPREVSFMSSGTLVSSKALRTKKTRESMSSSASQYSSEEDEVQSRSETKSGVTFSGKSDPKADFKYISHFPMLTGPKWSIRTMPAAFCQIVGVHNTKTKADVRFVVRDSNMKFLRMFRHTEFDVLGSPLEDFFIRDDAFVDFDRFLSQTDPSEAYTGSREFRLHGQRGSRNRSSSSTNLSLGESSSSERTGKSKEPGVFPCAVTVVSNGAELHRRGRIIYDVYIRDISKELTNRALLEAEKQKSTDLLLNMMPAPIVDRLKRNERPIAFAHTNVSCIFVDIVGFSTICQNRIAEGPGAIVSLLDNLYTRFDIAADSFCVFKVKIIGDCWFGATGLRFSNLYGSHHERDLDVRKDALAAVQFCLEVIRIVNEFGMHVRCGVHTGPVVSGVISKNRYLYDIYGFSVNYAARLEQACPKIDGVHLSRETCELISPWYQFSSVNSLFKGHESAVTYLLGPEREVPEDFGAAAYDLSHQEF